MTTSYSPNTLMVDPALWTPLLRQGSYMKALEVLAQSPKTVPIKNHTSQIQSTLCLFFSDYRLTLRQHPSFPHRDQWWSCVESMMALGARLDRGDNRGRLRPFVRVLQSIATPSYQSTALTDLAHLCRIGLDPNVPLTEIFLTAQWTSGASFSCAAPTKILLDAGAKVDLSVMKKILKSALYAADGFQVKHPLDVDAALALVCASVNRDSSCSGYSEEDRVFQENSLIRMGRYGWSLTTRAFLDAWKQPLTPAVMDRLRSSIKDSRCIAAIEAFGLSCSLKEKKETPSENDVSPIRLRI